MNLALVSIGIVDEVFIGYLQQDKQCDKITRLKRDFGGEWREK